MRYNIWGLHGRGGGMRARRDYETTRRFGKAKVYDYICIFVEVRSLVLSLRSIA